MKNLCFDFMSLVLTIVVLIGFLFVGGSNSDDEVGHIINEVYATDIFPFRYTDDNIPSLYEYISYEKYDQQFLIDSMGREYLLRNNLDGTETIIYSGTSNKTQLIVHCIPQGVLTLIAGDASLLPNVIDSYFTFHGYYTENNRAIGIISTQERENLLTSNNYIPRGVPISNILKPKLIKRHIGYLAYYSAYYLSYPDGTSIRIRKMR